MAKGIDIKKKVLIHGYDYINLGDDLFFQILVSRYPNVDFFMVSHNDYQKVINGCREMVTRYLKEEKDWDTVWRISFYGIRQDEYIC